MPAARFIRGFVAVFGGFPIGSNDRTQLAPGLDRDSGIAAQLSDVRNPAVERPVADVTRRARACGRKVRSAARPRATIRSSPGSR